MPEWIYQIEQLIAEWKSVQPLDAATERKLQKKFRLEFNYHSNHIEGNTLTYGETELLLLFDDTKGGHSMREYEEMKAHDVAWQMIEQWAQEKERPLTDQGIKNLNEIILVRPFWKEAITPDGHSTRRQISIGNYKQYPNTVRLANGEIFDYASPIETPVLMQELLNWYRTEQESLHPVTLAAMFHYKFVRIHPFDDGNGRLARLLMNYVFLWHKLPPVIIKSADKQSYLRALHIADTGNYEPFINYVAEQLAWSLRISIRAAKGENIEEEEDWQKKLLLLKIKLGAPNEVVLRKSPEAFRLSMENIILPFLERWESDLAKIDPLFNSRGCELRLNNSSQVITARTLVEGWNACFDQSGQLLLPASKSSLEEISVNVQFKDLRRGNLQGGVNGGSATITFYENALKIAVVTGKEINKLYSERLMEEEISILANDLGRWLVVILDELATRKDVE